jgi:PAS domain S-box-containing protein
MEDRATPPLEHAKRLSKDHPSDIVSLYSMDEICRYASPSHEAILGYKPEEAVGNCWTHFVAPQDHSHAALAGADALLNGESIIFGFNAVTKSGERKSLRGHAKIMVDPATDEAFLIFHAHVVKA